MLAENLNIIKNAFLTYAGGNLIWILYALALVYLAAAAAKDKKQIFLIPLFVMLLTVWNPLLTQFLTYKTSLLNRYPRFFWMTLYFVVIAWAIVDLMGRFGKKAAPAILAASVLAVVLLGTPVFWGKDTAAYEMTENPQFVKNEIIELNDAFHREGLPRPKVLYGAELMTTYRVYDPTVLSLTSKNLLRIMQARSLGKFSRNYHDQDLVSIYRVFYYEDDTEDPAEFITALKNKKVHYVVPVKTSGINQYLEDAGFVLLQETQHHMVWKVPE